MRRLGRLGKGWSVLLLLAAMIVVMSRALVATEWAANLEIVLWSGLGGLVAGFLLGWSVFPGGWCHWLSAVYGIAWLGTLLGRDLPGALTWRERILELASHLGYWLYQAVSGGTGRDVLIFVMLLGALAWILGYNAAYNTFRRSRVWLALIPLSAAMLAIVIYDTRPVANSRYLVGYLFLALLAIGDTHILEQQERWRAERVLYGGGLHGSAFRAVALVAVVVLALAWALPSAAALPRLTATWRRLSEPWQHVQEEWERLFSTLHGPPISGLVEPFGPSLGLGEPQEVRDVLVMDVRAEPGLRYYWRGATYSTYDTDRWTAQESERILLIPRRQPPGLEVYAGRRPVTQTITSYVPDRMMLVAAEQWATVNREADAYIDRTGDAPLDFIRVFSVLPLEAGGQYMALSYVSEASAADLRASGADYPPWVLERYLQVPLALPERVGLLAEEITAGAETPYDKAIALEQYLRQTITYDLRPPELPAGRDYVDFLLFESRRDYCEGYATAMVMLARSVGIPARLAVGYGQGEYDAERGVFRVRENNAHSWPELYFPTYGWITFEPTSSELPSNRPEEPAADASPEDVPAGAGRGLAEEEGVGAPLEGGDSDEWQIERLRPRAVTVVLWVGGALLALVGLAAGGVWAVENWGLRDLSPVERAYARLLRSGRWLGHPLSLSDTPREWASELIAIAPAAQQPVDDIVGAYVRMRFARATTPAHQVQASWLRARPALWRAWLGRLVPRRTDEDRS